MKHNETEMAISLYNAARSAIYKTVRVHVDRQLTELVVQPQLPLTR